MIEKVMIDKENIRSFIWSIFSSNGSRHEYEENWFDLFSFIEYRPYRPFYMFWYKKM